MRQPAWLLMRLFLCFVGCALVAAWGLDDRSSPPSRFLAVAITCWALWVITSPVERES